MAECSCEGTVVKLPLKEKKDLDLLPTLPMCMEDEDEDYFCYFDDDNCTSKPQSCSYEKEDVKWARVPSKLSSKHERARQEALVQAERLASEVVGSPFYNKKYAIIFNPVSGQGKAKKVVEHMVVPMLQHATLKFTAISTEYRGHATEFVSKMDPKEYRAVIVCGGDGMVSEVVTGLMLRTDDASIPIGIVPLGTANAMANHLDGYLAANSTALIGRAVLSAIRATTRKIDVIECETGQGKKYGLSCIGWGLAGAVAQQADKMRWLPGQKSARYDIAGLITVIKSWPVVSRCTLEYPVSIPQTDGSSKIVWEEQNVACVNMIASKVPKLGADHPISPDIEIDDGKLYITLLPETSSRIFVAKLANAMKKGKWLAKQDTVISISSTEFKLTPMTGQKGSDIPFNLDGDPIEAGPLHVRILKQRIEVFATPEKKNAYETRTSSFSRSSTTTTTSASAQGGASLLTPPLSSATPSSSLSSSSSSALVKERPTSSISNDSPEEIAVSDDDNDDEGLDTVSGVLPVEDAPDDDLLQLADSDTLSTSSGGATSTNTTTTTTTTVTSTTSSSTVRPSLAQMANRPSLETLYVEGANPDGSINIVMSASLMVTHVQIDPHMMSLTNDQLGAQLKAAFNNAINKAQATADNERRFSVSAVSSDKGKAFVGKKTMTGGSAYAHRKEIIESAVALGLKAAEHGALMRRRVTIIYNPVSGSGKAKITVEQMVVPILEHANVLFEIIPTQYRGHATEFMQKLDLSSTNGVIVCGGDGMVSEVVSGLMLRKDKEAEDFPVGIVPVGTANAMANYLDKETSASQTILVGHAVLAVAYGHTRKVDVIDVSWNGGAKYGLSCIGWGLAGAVGLQADKMRWIPGQKQARYDIAGFVTMLKDWPVVCRGVISYPKEGQTEWVKEPLSCINLIATNVPKLGVDHPIARNVAPDDGHIVVAILDDTASRTQTVQTALTMKKGKFLTDHKLMRSIRTREFKLSPQLGAKGSNIPFNIDGDPLTAKPIHVKVHQQRLRVFSLPDSVLAEYTKTSKDKVEAQKTTKEKERPAFVRAQSELSYLDQFDEAISDDESLGPSPKKDSIKWPKMPRLYCNEEKARKRVLELAENVGRENKASGQPQKHFTVIYNPISGAGKAKKVVYNMVIPILNLANVRFDVVPTQHRGFATNFTRTLDENSTNGIIVCGGDGMVSEVTTGLMSRTDGAAARLSIGIVPVGTANAMANELDGYKSKCHTMLVGRAVIAAVRGYSRNVDVIAVIREDDPTKTKYGLSCIGWALAGQVAQQADKMRWVPGQKSARYDIAGFVTMIKDWPVVCRAVLSIPDETKTTPNGEKVWVDRNIAMQNFISSNVPRLGKDHPISPDISVDDGKIITSMIYETATRAQVIGAALSMKKGKYLANHRNVVSFIASEYKLRPQPGAKGSDIPFNVDGDPVEAGPIHVKVIRKGLSVFCLKELNEVAEDDESSGDQETGGDASTTTSVAGVTTTESTDSDAANITVTEEEDNDDVFSNDPDLAEAEAEEEAEANDDADEENEENEPIGELSSKKKKKADPGANVLRRRRASYLDSIDLPALESALTEPVVDEFDYVDESGEIGLAGGGEDSSSSAAASSGGGADGQLTRSGSVSGKKPKTWSKFLPHLPHLHSAFGKDRKKILKEAEKIAKSIKLLGLSKQRRICVIYNPVSGAGKAKKVVDSMVIPVLKHAKIAYEVVPTQHRGFATDYVNKLDISAWDGILVCGGDGMVSEVITGLLTRTDDASEKFPVGIIPVGTANAMANYLDKELSTSQTQLVGRAALAVCRGHTIPVDAIEAKWDGGAKYGLSCIGWGLAGAVGLQADKMRWMPGQKQARYDIAGFVTMVKDWPVVSRGKFSYLEERVDSDGKVISEWKEEHIGFVNMIATNVPKLGVAHPISPNVTADDGFMVLAILDETTTRPQAISAGLAMKKGKYLAEQKLCREIRTREFKLSPQEGARGSDIPFLIDGDPLDPVDIHVRVLKRRLLVFHNPE